LRIDLYLQNDSGHGSRLLAPHSRRAINPLTASTVRPAVDAKLSCDACNLVNQSGGHSARVRTGGESTLQIVNKRLPGKSLRRNDQGSVNHCEGLDFRYPRSNFQGRKGAAHYALCCENVSFIQGKNRTCLDDPMTIRVKWIAQAWAWADSDTGCVVASTTAY